MVSFQHEAMHQLLRNHTGVFVRACRDLNVSFGKPTQVEVLPNEMSHHGLRHSKPLFRYPDSVVRYTFESGEEPVAVLVESQLSCKKDKPAAWGYYISYIRAMYDIAAVVVVICRDRQVAKWAAGPFHDGPPQWRSLTVRTLVLGPDNVQVVTDP